MRHALNLYDANKARDRKEPSVRHQEKILTLYGILYKYLLFIGTQ